MSAQPLTDAARPAQTGDLRSLAIRRAGRNRRVAVLGSDAPLIRGLEANGCTVLVDPAGPDALEHFAPDVVIAFDGLLAGSDGVAFRRLAQAAPEADLVFSCANAGGASALIHQLVGRQVSPGQSESSVRGWLREAGYAVVARDLVVEAINPSGLAADAEATLRALLEQVSPGAAADRWLWVARQGAASADERLPGLLSVVGGGESPHTPHERVRSLADARGQYVTFVKSGDVIYREHHARLISALQRSTSAWALESSIPAVEALRRGAVASCAWVVDRDRLGTFSLSLADDVPAAEAVLFARLLAVFPPALVPGGPSYERQAPPEPISQALVVMQPRPLRMLVTLSELLAQPPMPRLRNLVRERLGQLWRERLRPR